MATGAVHLPLLDHVRGLNSGDQDWRNDRGVKTVNQIAHEYGVGRGAFDNIFVERLWRSVKHQDVYLNGYACKGELLIGLTKH